MACTLGQDTSTRSPGSQHCGGSTPRSTSHGAGLSREKHGALRKCRRQWQSRMIVSQESKPLALRLRGGLVLPLLSTLPTTSTCLSQRDPRNKGWEMGDVGGQRELDLFPCGRRARSCDARQARAETQQRLV